MVPSGGHVVSPIRPPGRQSRANSLATASGRLANITPQVEVTTLKVPDGRSHRSASPTRNTTSRLA
jgi:hypothetical protein